MLATSSAVAAKPTKKECAAANEAAHDLRSAGRLREARASLAVCTAASCPGPIREDCAQRLEEIDAAIPSVVFVATDGADHDLSNVRVTMDGAPLLEKLDGAAVTLDPGEHHFVFESDGLRSAESTVLLREGDSNRPVRVVLQSARARARAPAPAPAPAHDDAHVAMAPAPAQTRADAPWLDASIRRSLGLSLGAAGAAGVVLGAVFTLMAKSTYDRAIQTECVGGDPKRCTPQGKQDGQTAHSQAVVSTAAFVGGGALLAGGAALYFTAPKSDDVAISAAVSSGGAAFAVRGKW